MLVEIWSGIQVILVIWSFLSQSNVDGPNLLTVFLSCPIMIGCNPSPFSLFGVAYCEPILFQFRISLTINPSPWLDYSPFPTIPELGAILLSSLPFALTLTFVDVSLLTELLLSGIISLLLLLWALPLKFSNPISLKIWVIFFIFITIDVLSDVCTTCVLIFIYQFFSLYFLIPITDPLLVVALLHILRYILLSPLSFWQVLCLTLHITVDVFTTVLNSNILNVLTTVKCPANPLVIAATVSLY